MPSTVKYALNYPSGTTAPNVPVSMQTSMESVEAALIIITNLKHVEYSGPAFTTSAGTGVNFGGPAAGLFTADATKTFNNTFVQPDAAGRIKILQTGIYALSGIILPTGTPAAYSLAITDITNSTPLASFGGNGYGNKEESVSAPNVYIVANTVVEFGLVTSNSITLGSRIRITKVQG